MNQTSRFIMKMNDGFVIAYTTIIVVCAMIGRITKA